VWDDYTNSDLIQISQKDSGIMVPSANSFWIVHFGIKTFIPIRV